MWQVFFIVLMFCACNSNKQLGLLTERLWDHCNLLHCSWSNLFLALLLTNLLILVFLLTVSATIWFSLLRVTCFQFFPYGWSFMLTISSSLFLHAIQYWIFTNCHPHRNNYKRERQLEKSGSLHTPEPRNPQKVSKRSSRTLMFDTFWLFFGSFGTFLTLFGHSGRGGSGRPFSLTVVIVL